MNCNDKIKISVIIPVYNACDYVSQCLDSVLAQSLKEIEIICVDDGSTDNSYEILQRYQKADGRIRVIRQENQFAGIARNRGIKIASGEYLYFLDSDDYIEETFLEKMYEAARNNDADVVICDVFFEDMFTGRIDPRISKMEKDFLPEKHSRFNRINVAEGLFQITNGWPWDKLFRRGFIEKESLSFTASRTANDGYFVFMALGLAESIAKVDERLVTHRMNDLGSLSNTRESSWHCGFEMLYDIEDGLRRAHIYDSLRQSFLNFALSYLLWSMEEMRSGAIRKKIFRAIVDEAGNRWELSQYGAEYFYDGTWYKKYIYMVLHSFEEYEQKYFIEFPFKKVARGSKIVLYGAGRNGKKYYQQLQDTGYASVVFWLDQKFENAVHNKMFGWLDDLGAVDYDYIVITLDSECVFTEIRSKLLEAGIPAGKII